MPISRSASLPESPKLTSEIEVKFLVDPQQFPEDLKTALSEGTTHPSIAEKGRITQAYLPVTQEIADRALAAIMSLPLEALSEADIQHFSDVKNVTEIRILQREQTYLSPKKRSECDEPVSVDSASTKDPDAFQITMKGVANPDGTSRPNIETPITTNRRVCEAVVAMLESLNEGKSMNWHNNVKTVEKMWYDLTIPDPSDPNGTLTVELDIFPDINYLAVAEVEFKDLDSLNRARSGLPAWFFKDITHDEAFKVRNLAGKTDLAQIDSKKMVDQIADIRGRLAVVYQPTALGDALGAIDPTLIEDMSFVILGSFKRWLPQFRRISQDLWRRSAGVYPPISMLDIARRQIATDRADAAFRIEAEEDFSLVEAERQYLDRIKNGDGVYLVAPEGRVGRSSGQEAAYAVSRGKALFLSNVVTKVASDTPDNLRILFSAIIKDIMFGGEKGRIQKINLTPVIMHYLERTIKDEAGVFDEKFMRTLMAANRDNLLGNSDTEDQNRVATEAKR